MRDLIWRREAGTAPSVALHALMALTFCNQLWSDSFDAAGLSVPAIVVEPFVGRRI